MKQQINLSTLKGSTFTLTAETWGGMIHMTASVGGSEYTLIRLPQELKQWPIGSTLRMHCNSGSDFGGMLEAELDGESAARLAALLGEAAERVNDARECEAAAPAPACEEEADTAAAQDEDDFWQNIFSD